MSDAAQSDDARSAREDIAFMRNLAQEGASGPLLGGSFLLAAGLIYSAASFAVWWVLTHEPSKIGAASPWIWGIAVGSHVVIMGILGFRFRRARAGVINRQNRAFRAVWNGVGAAIFCCVASFDLTAWQAHSPGVFAGYPAVILALYGVGWTVTASSSSQKWTWGVAALSFLFAVVAGAFAASVNLALLFAIAILLLLAVPGALLIKRASVRS